MLIVGVACTTRPRPSEPVPPPRPPVAGGDLSAAATSAVRCEQAQTGEERRAVLDRQFDDSLASFDARLRKEQQRIAQERDARQATVATSMTPTTTPAGEKDGDVSPGNEQAVHATNGNGALATEMPDGNDDDIIARRLRKAAEQETDPELRDRMWKEYVEYKKNAQVK
jgi:hypothetical protein